MVKQNNRYLFKYISIYIDINFQVISKMYQYIKLKFCFQYVINAFHWMWPMWSRALLFYVLLQRTELGSNKAMLIQLTIWKVLCKSKIRWQRVSCFKKIFKQRPDYQRNFFIEYIAPSKISIMSHTHFPTTVCTPLPHFYVFPPSQEPIMAFYYLIQQISAIKWTKHTWLVSSSSVSSTDSLYDFIKLIAFSVIFLTWEVKGFQRSSHFIDCVSKIWSL